MTQNINSMNILMQQVAEELDAHGLGHHSKPSECRAGAVLAQVRSSIWDEAASGSENEVCIDCPAWAWDEQPDGIYGMDSHRPLGSPDDGYGITCAHPWRGARIVPIEEETNG